MLLLVGCGIAIAIAVIVIGPASAKEAPASTAIAQRGTVQQTVSGSGSLEAGRQADLNFKSSGTIERVYVQEGQQVTKGELLAALDDSDAHDSLDQAEANLSSAQASLDSAEAGSTTTSSSGANPSASAQAAAIKQGTDGGSSNPGKAGKGSGGGGNGSSAGSTTSTQTQSSEAKQASVASARANLESAEISVNQAEQDIADTRLRAPMSGLVTSISGAAGESVSGGGTSTSESSGDAATASTSASGSGTGAVASTSGASTSNSSSSSSDAFITLADLDQMKVSVDLSEADIADVKVGQAATVTVNALDDQEFAAHIISVGLTSSEDSGVVTYPVTLLLDQGSKELKPGMTGSAEVVVAQADGAISIPSSALTGTSVTVQGADGKTTVKQVTTGLVGESSTQVLSGLQAGDKVVLQTQAAASGSGTSGSPSGSPPGGGGLSGGGPPGGGGP